MRSPDLRYSIFVVPKDAVIEGKGKVRGAVKGRKRDRVLVLNRVSQSIVDARRGKHPTHVFAYRDHPLQTMSNTAWQGGRRKAGLEDATSPTRAYTTCGTRLGCGCARRTSARVRSRTSCGISIEP